MTAQLETQAPDLSNGTANFEALQQQFQEEKSHAVQKPKTSELDVGEQAGDSEGMDAGSPSEGHASHSKKEAKKIRFAKGEQVWDIDEDALAEIKADKSTRSLSAREMRDKASGEIAIENRMREVAERKKEQDAFIKKFTQTAKADPIKALEQMLEFAGKADPDLNFNKYVNDLIKQAESLSTMSEAEKRAWDLDRKLKEKDQILKEKEDAETFELKREEFVTEAQISPNEFDRMARTVLDDPEIAQHIKSTDDLFKVVDEFHYEVAAQKVAYAALSRVSKGLPQDDPIVFELADVLKKNPDFTPEDVSDIARELFQGEKREQAAKVLSRKQRSAVSTEDYRTENLSPFEFLEMELKKDREALTKNNSNR